MGKPQNSKLSKY